MNRDGFGEFLQRLEPGREPSEEQYDKWRRKLIMFFEWRCCDDATRLADETIARVLADSYRGVEVEKLWANVYGVAMKVYKDFLRQKSRRAIQVLEYQIRQPDDSSDCGRASFAALDEDKRKLLEAYYSDDTTAEALAQTAGISLGALRIKVHRIRAEWRSNYRDCMEKKVRGEH